MELITADYESMDLVFDTRDAPLPRMLLEARQDDSVASSTASSSTATGTSLPRPFDSSLGNNFTSSSCPQFFTNFLSNPTFQQCLPFSLLLQTSNSFFSVSRSLVELTQTLDATCAVNLSQCSNLMSSLAVQIKDKANCGQDLQYQNPLVVQAYNGLVAYSPLYQAGCLKDGQGDYCFANAVMNASAPSAYYIYYLPVGLQLPSGSRPTCNKCLQDTMSIFATVASNSSQPLSTDYVAAANMVDMSCGTTFVQDKVQVSSAGHVPVILPSIPSFLALLSIFLVFLL